MRLLLIGLLLAGCTTPTEDLLLSPAERCQQAREAYAGIVEPTVEHRGLLLTACAQYITGG
jgi:hypothetical protein